MSGNTASSTTINDSKKMQFNNTGQRQSHHVSEPRPYEMKKSKSTGLCENNEFMH